MPSQAQLAPINGIVIKDFNNDNKLDIVLGGNFYGTRVKYGRYDASKGSILLGDGKGGFGTVNNIKSGFNLDGEVRDIVNVKTTGGKQMLIFARNNASLRTFLW